MMAGGAGNGSVAGGMSRTGGGEGERGAWTSEAGEEGMAGSKKENAQVRASTRIPGMEEGHTAEGQNRGRGRGRSRALVLESRRGVRSEGRRAACRAAGGAGAVHRGGSGSSSSGDAGR